MRTVSEVGGTPIAAVLVQVDDQPWTPTDANGRAEFRPAAAGFTVRAHQVIPPRVPGTIQAEYVWQLAALDSNEVVVPVDGSRVPTHHFEVTGAFVGATSGVPVKVWAAEYRAHEYDAHLTGDTTFAVRMDVESGAAHCVTVRALGVDDGFTETDPPTRYAGWASTTVEVSDPTGKGLDPQGAGVEVTARALELQPVSAARVSGSITVPAALASQWLHAELSLQFSDGSESGGPGGPVSLFLGRAILPAGSTSFDLLFPGPTGSRPFLTMYAGDLVVPGLGGGAGTMASVILDHGASGVMIRLPEPPILLAPVDGGSVEPTTVFRWSSAPGKAHVWGWCDGTPAGVSRLIQFRNIEATGTEATLPTAPGLGLTSRMTCRFNVRLVPAESDAQHSLWASSVPVSVTVP